jgi:membrane protein DedA with SNARE-associated domain
MIEDFGIPVPGETILIAGGIYAGAGQLNIVTVGIIGFAAAVIGDNIGFAIGHFGGRALALRWGKYIFLTEERLDKTEAFFNRHGGKIIVVARFIEGLRQANGIIAGITGMRWRHFLAYNVVGAALWVGAWVSIGYFAGSSIDSIYHAITRYSTYVLIALVVLVVAYIIWRVRRRRRTAVAKADHPGPAQDAPPESDAVPASDAIPASDAVSASDVIPASDAVSANDVIPANGTLPADGYQADEALAADENGAAGHSRPAGSVQSAGDDAHSGS